MPFLVLYKKGAMIPGYLSLIHISEPTRPLYISYAVFCLKKKDPEAPQNTILVLDATTGQNAISQVETFREIAEVSGLIMTKLDGTAKGGVLVALADKFGLPIHAIGVGEQIDDLAPFDPAEFAQALTGSGS